MLEELLITVVRSQVGNLKRRTTGAVLEGVALGLVGLGVVFIAIGLYALLSRHMAEWQAALILAGVALVIAAAVFLVGRSMLQHNERRQREQIHAVLERLGLLSRPSRADRPENEGGRDPGPALVAAALAAGVILGRSMKR
jgi:high-affinity Fe2+/Pb2+ permease